jgi:hypothetical protein
MALVQKAQTVGVEGIALRQDSKAGEVLSKETLQKILLCKETPLEQRVKTGPNCASTALFITGEIDKDKYVNPKTVYSTFLRKLQKIESPRLGCIVAWTFDLGSSVYVEHMAVVTATAPHILVTHRKALVGDLVENQPIEVVGLPAKLNYCKEEYFLPKNIKSMIR